MKISVIFPVYNVENYVEKSIQSILKQTFTNFELIVVNDCSTDSSLNVISKFKDSRLRVINNKRNLGLSASRNIGLNNATGEITYFMDSDDQILPNFFELVVKIIEDNPGLNMISFNYKKCSYQVEPLKLKSIKGYTVHPLSSDDALKNLMYGKLSVTAWSYIVRTPFLKKIGYHFSDGMLFEDMNTTSFLLSKVKQVLFVEFSPEPYLYLQRKNSIMGKNHLKPGIKEIDDNFSMIMAEYKIIRSALREDREVNHWLLDLLLYYHQFYYCIDGISINNLKKYSKEILLLASKMGSGLTIKERMKVLMVKYPYLYRLRKVL